MGIEEAGMELHLLILLLAPLTYAEYSEVSSNSRTETLKPEIDLDIEGRSMNDPGMDATSKACRYDDGPGWSDCDPFELSRFRVLRLIHGGSQCEEVKNITKHCTPHEFPYGTHWLIQEHRKCIAELNRLKSMISDLYKHIEVMHQKGKELFAAYLKLKNTLDELTQELDKLKVEGEHQQEVLAKIKDEIEDWKSKARELQVQLDEMKSKFHDLEAEEHELNLQNEQLTTDINIISKENEGLKRRIVETIHTKEQLKDMKERKGKLSTKLEKLQDQLQDVRDSVAEARIKLLAKNFKYDNDELETKDTHVDLSMEMFITHNKTTLYKPTYKPFYYTTEKYYEEEENLKPKCLISYYGVTNETCWYETDGEKSEDVYVDALGHHLVEAHWKYFTIEVNNQYECDKASHLHYEFLLNRCSPKHYLPVLSVYRPNKDAKELGTHVYPKVPSSGANACWITFLGAHGHCEKHSQKYDLYNTADESHANSKEDCLARAKWWMDYCDTPVIATYVPEEASTNWESDWIMHDSHGGRMFEDEDVTQNHINPDSLKPESANPSQYKSEYKSMEPKSPDYHDSPEYRKSLHLQGEEKEAILAKLRQRLGMSGKASKVSNDVKHHTGVDTGPNEEVKSEPVMNPSYEEKKPEEYTEAPYQPTEAPYETTEASYQPTDAPYQPSEASYEPTEAPYQPTEPPAAYSTEKPYETEAPYEEPTTQPPYEEPPKYEEPEKDESAEKY